MTHTIKLIKKKLEKIHTDVCKIQFSQFILITVYKNIAPFKNATDSMMRGVWTFRLVPSAVVTSVVVSSVMVSSVVVLTAVV